MAQRVPAPGLRAASRCSCGTVVGTLRPGSFGKLGICRLSPSTNSHNSVSAAFRIAVARRQGSPVGPPNLGGLDMRKLNTGIGALVKQQVGIGLAPPAVLNCARAQYDPVAFAHFMDAGGAKLNGITGLQDIHNIGRSSKRLHPDPCVSDGVEDVLTELIELEHWLQKGEWSPNLTESWSWPLTSPVKNTFIITVYLPLAIM